MKYYIGKVPFGKDDNDSLTHYGRKGMKWGKNIFEDAVDTVRGATRTIGNATGNVARQISKTAGSVGSRVGKAAGNFVGNYVTGSIPKAEAERQMRIGDIHLKNAWNASDNSRNTYMRSRDNRNDDRTVMELKERSNKSNNYADSRAKQAKEAYENSVRAQRQYNRAFIPALKNELAGYASAGKAIGNAIGGAAGGAANAVGNAIGGAANAAGNWVGDRARDVDRFVNTSITGKNFHDQADRLRSSGNQDAVNVANQLDEIGNRSLLGRAGNLVNNIGNAVGGAGQWVGDRVNDANRFINTSITGKNFYDQANQIRANSNNPEAAAVADQLDEIGNRSLFGRIGNAVGQAGQWIGDRANDVGNAVGGAANAAGQWAGDRVRDINDLAGQAGNAVGNWVGDRARDVQNFASDPGKTIGDFVDRNITGDSARAEAKEQNRMADRYDTVSKSAIRTGIDDISKAINNNDDELFNKGLFLRNYGFDQMDKYYDARGKANEAQRQADSSLAGRLGQAGQWLGERANDVGNAVGQAGQAVGQTMSNIGDWGGEQLDRGKRILGRLFGRR